MISVRCALPTSRTANPPIILIHGAANSAGVWTIWQREMSSRGWPTYATDLRGHGVSTGLDLSHTSMWDYASDVRSLAEQLRERPILMGWSMGGLLAMMVPAEGGSVACVALAPSMPAQKTDTSVKLHTGDFGPEEYGTTSSDPGDQPGMPDLDRDERTMALKSLCRESRLARDERRAGIVIESLPCPL